MDERDWASRQHGAPSLDRGCRRPRPDQRPPCVNPENSQVCRHVPTLYCSPRGPFHPQRPLESAVVRFQASLFFMLSFYFGFAFLLSFTCSSACDVKQSPPQEGCQGGPGAITLRDGNSAHSGPRGEGAL